MCADPYDPTRHGKDGEADKRKMGDRMVKRVNDEMLVGAARGLIVPNGSNLTGQQRQQSYSAWACPQPRSDEAAPIGKLRKPRQIWGVSNYGIGVRHDHFSLKGLLV